MVRGVHFLGGSKYIATGQNGETRVSFEVLTQPDAFLSRPCARKVEDVVHLKMEKKGTLENQLQIS